MLFKTKNAPKIVNLLKCLTTSCLSQNALYINSSGKRNELPGRRQMVGKVEKNRQKRPLLTLYVDTLLSCSLFSFFGFSCTWPITSQFFLLQISIVYNFFYFFKIRYKSFFLVLVLNVFISIVFRLIRIFIILTFHCLYFYWFNTKPVIAELSTF